MKDERQNGQITKNLEEEIIGAEVAYRIIDYLKGKTFDRRSREQLSADVVERILWECHGREGSTWGDFAAAICRELGADEEEVTEILKVKGIL